jgi:hypothetical protein
VDTREREGKEEREKVENKKSPRTVSLFFSYRWVPLGLQRMTEVAPHYDVDDDGDSSTS